MKRFFWLIGLTLFLMGSAFAQQANQLASSFVGDLLQANSNQQIRTVIERNVDLGYMMTTALGAQVTEMNAAQLKRFADALRGVLAAEVSSITQQVSGGRFLARRTGSDRGGTLVSGIAYVTGTSSGQYPVQILVRDKKIGDVNVGGTWASIFLRNMVNQMLDVTKGDVESMVTAFEGSTGQGE